MTLTRLVAVTLLLCALPAFGQANPIYSLSAQKSPVLDSNKVDTNKPAAAMRAEPWQVIPNAPALSDIGTPPRDFAQQFALNPGKIDRGDSSRFDKKQLADQLVSKDSSQPDVTCYSIRSYIVARDSKDSDSTHPAGYSTCQRADRYRLKSAEEHAIATER